MTQMAPTRPYRPPSPASPMAKTGSLAAMHPRVCHVRLAACLAAVAAARAEVEAAIRAWCVPVDPDIAVLLTSELVTNAVTHAAADAEAPGVVEESVILVIACDAAGLRVDVHDESGDLPVLADCPVAADAETGRGLLLVTSLSAEWGFYRTAGGKAVYFTLRFSTDVHEAVSDGPNGRGPRSVS